MINHLTELIYIVDICYNYVLFYFILSSKILFLMILFSGLVLVNYNNLALMQTLLTNPFFQAWLFSVPELLNFISFCSFIWRYNTFRKPLGSINWMGCTVLEVFSSCVCVWEVYTSLLQCWDLTFPRIIGNHIIHFMSLDLPNMPCADIRSKCRDKDSLKDL